MEKKIPLNLFLLLSYLPSPEKLVSTATRYKIVALKMHETTFNHPEWWIDLFPHHSPHKNITKPIFFALGDPWPLFPFSHHHSGQRIIHVISKQEVLRWSQRVRVEAIPSVGSSSCRPSGGSPCFVELHLKWTVTDPVTTFLQPGANCARNSVLNFKKKTDHLLKSCCLYFS